MRLEGWWLTHEDKMPNVTCVSPKKKRLLICATFWNKASSKKCVTKSWKPISTEKMRKPYVTKVQPWKISMLEGIFNGFQSLHFDILTLSLTRAN